MNPSTNQSGNQETNQPANPKKRGRKATGRIRNKILQIRLSEDEQDSLIQSSIRLKTTPTDLLRGLLNQLNTVPSPNEAVMIKVKGHLLYITKSEAKKLLIDLTSQI